MITEIFWLLSWPILITVSLFAITKALKFVERNETTSPKEPR
jgi:hypothetical protein